MKKPNINQLIKNITNTIQNIDIINDDIIKTVFKDFPYNKDKITDIIQNNINLYQYIMNRYDDSNDLIESYIRILNNIEISPKCKHCGKKIKFNSSKYAVKNKKFYGIFCSKYCKKAFAKWHDYSNIPEIITDDFIISYFYDISDKMARINGKKVKYMHDKIHNYLINRYTDIDENTTINEIIFRIIHKIEERPKCVICGEHYTKFIGLVDTPYRHTCCKECETIYKQQQTQKAILEKYGVDNISKVDFIKEKKRKHLIIIILKILKHIIN